MMKKILTFVSIVLFMGIFTIVYAQSPASITIENKSTGTILFQPEDTTGYNKLNTGTNVLNLKLSNPVYYLLVDKKMAFHLIYIEPGNKIKLVCTDSKLTISGDNSKINEFLQTNSFTCQAPQEIPTFSQAWKNWNENKIKEISDKLDRSGFSSQFVAIHKQYLRFVYLNQLINAPLIQKMFGQGNAIQLDDNYYDFLKDLNFNDEHILSVPKWFKVINSAMEEMEKQALIPVSNIHFMKHYASKIENEKLRSSFLVNLLSFILQKGYSDDFMIYLEDVKPLITDKDALTRLPVLIETYNKARETNKNLLRGKKMPDFTANTLDGKEFKLSDFKGKILVIDFWFTGCIPCKAEMPYFDKLAEEMQGKPIQFLSVSLDTGDQLMAAWRKMMEEKNSESSVLSLNIPAGFKSDYAMAMNIRSVPRIVLVDADGNIVDAYAKRPSDPKLREQINVMIQDEVEKVALNTILQNMYKTTSLDGKKQILDEFKQANIKGTRASSTLGMLYYYYCQSLASAGRSKELIETINQEFSAGFKRDLSFICGSTCWDNNDKETAEILTRQAVALSEQINEGKQIEGEEAEKYPFILSFYGKILLDQNRVSEATPYILKAYSSIQKPSSELQIHYLTVLMNQQKYAEAKPLLENLIRNGMSSKKYEEWLVEVYKAEKKPMNEYGTYLASLKKAYEEKLKKQVGEERLDIKAPLFTLKNAKGNNVSLADLKGKIVLLDFWATWCGPCKQSFPAMQKVVNKYKKDKEVVFLFIDTWDKEPQGAVKFLKDNKYDFELLFDTEKGDVAKEYKLTGIPAKILIDKNGVIRYSLKGFSGSDEKNLAELSAMIESLR